MKLCTLHLTELKNALTERHLGDMFQAGDDGEPHLIILAPGPETRATYNPLTAANTLIRRAALNVGGAYLIANGPNGEEYCPICEGVAAAALKDFDPKIVTSWITNAADAVVKYVGTLD